MTLKSRTARHRNCVFAVAWDDSRRRYVAADEHGKDLGLDCDFNNAIGSTVREANLASNAGDREGPGKGRETEDGIRRATSPPVRNSR